MSHDLATFGWSRPLSPPRIRQLTRREINRASIPHSLESIVRKEIGRRETVAVLALPKDGWEDYEPLRAEAEILSALAKASGPEGFLVFASKWGRLGVPAIELDPRDGTGDDYAPCELLSVWAREIWDLHVALALASGVTSGDEGYLKKVLAAVRIPDRDPRTASLLVERTTARLVLGRLVDRKVREHVKAAFVYDPEEKQHRFRLIPCTLLGACWLQAGAMITKQRIRLCARCGGWFAVNSKGRRKHDKYCGNTCRVGAARKRRRARELHAEGWSRKRIARELGTQPQLIASWVNRRTAQSTLHP